MRSKQSNDGGWYFRRVSTMNRMNKKGRHQRQINQRGRWKAPAFRIQNQSCTLQERVSISPEERGIYTVEQVHCRDQMPP